MPESARQEELVDEAAERLRAEGFRVVVLGRKSPDAVAVKDGRIFAVEILGYNRGKSGGRSRRNWTYDEKFRAYSMFDAVKILTFDYKSGQLDDAPPPERR